jgi:NlpC/P60 family putative phage cell wall peptidase
MHFRDELVAEAKTWVGTKYHHKGRVKGAGVDCGGLIYQVYKSITGLPHEPYPNDYPQDWALHKDNNEIYLSFLAPYVVETVSPLPGDVIMFKYGRAFSHGTIYIGDGKVVHAYGRTGFGHVLISNVAWFNIGRTRRLHKAYTLDDKWLLHLA